MQYKYIVLEGIHGSGKSAVGHALVEQLNTQGIKAQYYHMPDEGDKLGQVIRQVLTVKDLYKKWEVLGLLYAAFTNRFHITTQDDGIVYVMDRDAVTTGLIFQKAVPRDVRLEIYKYAIASLQQRGVMLYVKIDKQTALDRLTIRNQELASKDEVWKDKSKDNFVLENFAELTEQYENALIPQVQKLDIPTHTIDNSGALATTVGQARTYLFAQD